MAEFIQVMDACKRLCKAYGGCASYGKCAECVAYTDKDGCIIEYLGATARYRAKLVAIEKLVVKWLKDNPSKTMLDVFYEHFPKAERLKNGTLRICPHHLDPSWGGLCDDGKTGDCRACWAREVEG